MSHDTHPNSLISYRQCKADGQFKSLREYIRHLLETTGPKTRIEISAISRVKEGSLCAPLQEAVVSGEIIEASQQWNDDTHRMNTVYDLPKGQGSLF